MKRYIVGLAGLLTATLLIAGGSALAQTPMTAQEVVEECNVIFHDAETQKAQRCHAIVDAYLDSSTTTTTVPSTTTTTVPPTTTTTTAPPLVDPAPPTGDKFTILLRGLDNPDTEPVEPNRFWWDADYFRNLNSGAEWIDGDKIAYCAEYMFLRSEGQIVGRTTFVRIAYAKINDAFMVEGQRFFDGTFHGNGQSYRPDFCPQALSDDYTFSNAPDERPVIRFVDADEVLEVRNYGNTVAGEGITFDQISKTNTPFTITINDEGVLQTHTVYSRVTVVARENGNAVIVIYYDSLVPEVTITSNLP